MRELSRGLAVYICAVVAVGAVLLVRAAPSLPATGSEIASLATFAVLACLADLRQLELSYKANYSVATAINFGVVIVFGPAAATWAGALGAAAGDIARRKPWYKVAFNTCTIAISVAAGGAVMDAVRSTPPGTVGPSDLPALAAYGAINLIVNHVLVCTVIALSTGSRPWDVAVANFRGLFVPIIAVYPLGVLVSVTYIHFGGWLGVVLLAVPTFAVYGAVNGAQALRRHTVAALEALADTLDQRDPYTAQHSRRVADYCDRIAHVLGLSIIDREMLVEAARVHDLGKVSTPDGILHKQGPLSDDEWRIMREHPRAGEAILEKLPMYRRHALLVGSHHERLDGAGYPHRSTGQQIPLAARILTVADAFDAMTSNRPYRDGMPAVVAVARLREAAGTQFSSEVVEALATALSMRDREPAAESLATGGRVPAQSNSAA